MAIERIKKELKNFTFEKTGSFHSPLSLPTWGLLGNYTGAAATRQADAALFPLLLAVAIRRAGATGAAPETTIGSGSATAGPARSVRQEAGGRHRIGRVRDGVEY